MPHSPSRAKATMRISVELERKRLSYIMRARRKKTAAETLQTLIDEEAERLKSWKTHKEIEGKIPRAQFDDRVL
jgi:hypothetical protein